MHIIEIFLQLFYEFMHCIQPYLTAYFGEKVPFTFDTKIVITIHTKAGTTGIQSNSFTWGKSSYTSILLLNIQRFIFILFVFYRYFMYFSSIDLFSSWKSWIPLFVFFAQMVKFFWREKYNRLQLDRKSSFWYRRRTLLVTI